MTGMLFLLPAAAGFTAVLWKAREATRPRPGRRLQPQEMSGG
jgi:hypothetical protein